MMRDSASAPHTSTQRARPALDQAGGVVERDEEAGAGGVDVDGARLVRAEAGGDLGGEAGREPVGRERGDDHAVDLVGAAPGVGQRVRAGVDGQVGQGLAAVEPVALRMPVRLTIHSSVVSRRPSKCALVMTSCGTAAPMPNTPAFMPAPPGACA